ncbi:hypothetical protein [Priestia megaterium]|uniref:hypothetical protein n=1 Tax=Priestia megaterium TaxID=1404 RepID=UPI0037C5462F
MAVSIIEGFQEEAYLQELFEEKNVPKDNEYLIELLLLLKKYEGNTLQIGYESSNFSGVKTLNNYKVVVSDVNGYRACIDIYDGDENDGFFIKYANFEYFKRIYEKFPQRQYEIGYRRDESIYLAIC